jgi:uncharacterized protein YfdQ (DUF2303 family)
MSDYFSFIKEMYKVTRADLNRVLKKYFLKFLTDRSTVLVGPKNSQLAQMKLEFAQSAKFPINFSINEMSDFEIE